MAAESLLDEEGGAAFERLRFTDGGGLDVNTGVAVEVLRSLGREGEIGRARLGGFAVRWRSAVEGRVGRGRVVLEARLVLDDGED